MEIEKNIKLINRLTHINNLEELSRYVDLEKAYYNVLKFNRNREYEYLEDSNESYDINDIIDNWSDNKELANKLFYLSVFYPVQYESFCDYYGVKVENKKLVDTKNGMSTYREVADKKNCSPQTIRQNVIKATRILGHRGIEIVGDTLKNQEEYVIELVKTVRYRDRFNIVNLFNGTSFDADLVKHIRKYLNKTNNENILKYKDIINDKLNQIEQKYYENINNAKTL